MKSYGSSVFQYLRTTSDTRTWATAYKQNSKSTYNLSYERYGATIKVFTARTAIPLPSPLLPRERRGNRRRDDISWNNTAIVDSIPTANIFIPNIANLNFITLRWYRV